MKLIIFTKETYFFANLRKTINEEKDYGTIKNISSR